MLVGHVGQSSRRHFRPVRLRALAALTAALVAVGLVAATSPSVPARADTTSGGAFVAATGRVYDTRTAGNSALPPNTWRSVPVLGHSGIPSSGVEAVALSVTVVSPSATGTLNLYPSDATVTGTPAVCLTWEAGNTQSNTAMTAVGADGAVKIRSSSSASTNVLLDVQGYFTSGSGERPGGFVPVSGTRLADTRIGLGVPQAKLATGGTLTVDATRTGQVPAGEASSVYVQIAAVNPPGSGYFVPYAAGSARPSYPSVNFSSGQSTTIGVTVPVDSSGKFSLYLSGGGPTDVVVDLQGYYTSASGGALFNPLVARVYDSRQHTRLAAGETRTIPVSNVDGIPSVNSGLSAVAAELHVIAADGAPVVLKAWDSDYAEPGSTAVTAAESSLSLIAPGADNAIKVKNASGLAIDLYVDVEGWFSRTTLLDPHSNPYSPMVAVQLPQPQNSTSTDPGGLEYFYTDGAGLLHAGYQPSVEHFDVVNWSVISLDQNGAGPQIYGEPSVTVRSDRTVQATVLSADTGVLSKLQPVDPSPTWSASFVNFGGTFASAPVVGTLPDTAHSLVAFAVDTAGRLWARPQSGSAQYWQQAGETTGFVGAPTVVTTGTGLRLFAATSGGTVSTATYDNGVLSGWSDLGGAGVTDRPAAIMKPGFHAQVVIRQGDGSVVTKAQASDGSFPAAWTSVGSFTATGAPAVMLNTATGLVAIYARGASDHYIYESEETSAGSGTWNPWVVASTEKDPNNPDNRIPIASYTDPTITPYAGGSAGNAWLIPFRHDPSGAMKLIQITAAGPRLQSTTYTLPAQ